MAVATTQAKAVAVIKHQDSKHHNNKVAASNLVALSKVVNNRAVDKADQVVEQEVLTKLRLPKKKPTWSFPKRQLT